MGRKESEKEREEKGVYGGVRKVVEKDCFLMRRTTGSEEDLEEFTRMKEVTQRMAQGSKKKKKNGAQV